MSNEQLWKRFLLTIPDGDFFNVVRNYLGPVQTPYNKHDLIEGMIEFVHGHARTICERISPEELEILSAVEMLRSDNPHSLLSFFEDRMTGAQLYGKLINLMDRLVICRNPDSGNLMINPLLESGLAARGMGRAGILGGSPGARPAGSLPWLSDGLVLASLSLLHEDPRILKTDKQIKKSSLRRWEEALNLARPELQIPRLIHMLSLLGLVADEGSILSLPADLWDAWAELKSAQRHCYYWAAWLMVPADSVPALADFSQLSVISVQQELQQCCRLLHRFILSLDPGHFYSSATLRRILSRYIQEQRCNLAPGGVLAGLNDLGLLLGSDKGVQVNAHAREMLQESDARNEPGVSSPAKPDIRGPLLIVQSNYQASLQPAGDFHARMMLARCCRLLRHELMSEYEIQKDRMLHALEQGLTPGSLIKAIDLLAGPLVPQNIRFSIESWEQDAQSIELYQGYLLKAEGKHSSVLEHLAEGNQGIESLGSGRFFIQLDNPGLLEMLEDHDIHVRRLIRNAEAGRLSQVPPLPPIRFAPVQTLAPSPAAHTETASNRNPPAQGPESEDSADHVSDHASDRPKSAQHESGLPKPETPAAQVEELLEKVRQENPPEDVRKELILRIENGLMLDLRQIDSRSIRADITEARGLNYNGKLRLIEMAISGRDLLEFHVPGSPEPLLVRPEKIIKKPGRGSDLLAALQVPDNKALSLSISKASLIRRLKGRLFSKL